MLLKIPMYRVVLKNLTMYQTTKKITSILYIPPSKATPMYIGKIKCVYISQYVPTL